MGDSFFLPKGPVDDGRPIDDFPQLPKSEGSLFSNSPFPRKDGEGQNQWHSSDVSRQIFGQSSESFSLSSFFHNPTASLSGKPTSGVIGRPGISLRRLPGSPFPASDDQAENSSAAVAMQVVDTLMEEDQGSADWRWEGESVHSASPTTRLAQGLSSSLYANGQLGPVLHGGHPHLNNSTHVPAGPLGQATSPHVPMAGGILAPHRTPPRGCFEATPVQGRGGDVDVFGRRALSRDRSLSSPGSTHTVAAAVAAARGPPVGAVAVVGGGRCPGGAAGAGAGAGAGAVGTGNGTSGGCVSGGPGGIQYAVGQRKPPAVGRDPTSAGAGMHGPQTLGPLGHLGHRSFDTLDHMQDHDVASKKARGVCHFWPKCYRTDAECRFYHPPSDEGKGGSATGIDTSRMAKGRKPSNFLQADKTFDECLRGSEGKPGLSSSTHARHPDPWQRNPPIVSLPEKPVTISLTDVSLSVQKKEEPQTKHRSMSAASSGSSVSSAPEVEVSSSPARRKKKASVPLPDARGENLDCAKQSASTKGRTTNAKEQAASKPSAAAPSCPARPTSGPAKASQQPPSKSPSCAAPCARTAADADSPSEDRAHVRSTPEGGRQPDAKTDSKTDAKAAVGVACDRPPAATQPTPPSATSLQPQPQPQVQSVLGERRRPAGTGGGVGESKAEKPPKAGEPGAESRSSTRARPEGCIKSTQDEKNTDAATPATAGKVDKEVSTMHPVPSVVTSNATKTKSRTVGSVEPTAIAAEETLPDVGKHSEITNAAVKSAIAGTEAIDAAVEKERGKSKKSAEGTEKPRSKPLREKLKGAKPSKETKQRSSSESDTTKVATPMSSPAILDSRKSKTTTLTSDLAPPAAIENQVSGPVPDGDSQQPPWMSWLSVVTPGQKSTRSGRILLAGAHFIGGLVCALLAAAVVLVVRMHKYAAASLIQDHTVSLCFTLFWVAPLLMSAVIPIPTWVATSMLYTFLLQFFCVNASMTWIVCTSIVLPIFFLLEGVSGDAVVLELSGCERVILAFFVCSLRRKSILHPFVIFALCCLIGIQFIFSHTIWLEWLMLALGLSALHPSFNHPLGKAPVPSGEEPDAVDRLLYTPSVRCVGAHTCGGVLRFSGDLTRAGLSRKGEISAADLASLSQVDTLIHQARALASAAASSSSSSSSSAASSPPLAFPHFLSAAARGATGGTGGTQPGSTQAHKCGGPGLEHACGPAGGMGIGPGEEAIALANLAAGVNAVLASGTCPPWPGIAHSSSTPQQHHTCATGGSGATGAGEKNQASGSGPGSRTRKNQKARGSVKSRRAFRVGR